MGLFFKGILQIFVGMMWSVTIIFTPKGVAMIAAGFSNIMAAFFGAAIKGTAKVSSAVGAKIGEKISEKLDSNQEHRE